jgi:hypothetical protein
MVFLWVNSDNVVEGYHYKPFDEIDGMHKTKEELLQIGKLVDSVPEPTPAEGQGYVAKYNPATNTVYYEYFDLPPKPPTVEDQLKQFQDQISSQQEAIAELTILLSSMTS